MTRGRALIAALAFLMPALVAVFLLRLWPAAVALNTSLIPPGAESYSLGNFRFIFTDPAFLNSLKVTIVFLLIVNPLQIALALMLALLMNAAVPLIGFWRTVILLPVQFRKVSRRSCGGLPCVRTVW